MTIAPNFGGSSQQNAFPLRDGYTPLDRAATRHPVPVTSAATPRQSDGSTADQAHGALRRATSAFQAHLDSLAPVASEYSPAGLAKQIAAFSSTAAYRAVGDGVQKLADEADAAQAAAAAARAAVAEPDTATDAAVEIRAGHTWDRLRGELDAAAVKNSGGALFDTAVRLVHGATPDERAVLATQLPSYLRAHGQANAAWVDRAVQDTTPEYAAAVGNNEQAVRARDIAIDNASKLSSVVANTSSPFNFRAPTYTDPSAAQYNAYPRTTLLQGIDTRPR